MLQPHWPIFNALNIQVCSASDQLLHKLFICLEHFLSRSFHVWALHSYLSLEVTFSKSLTLTTLARELKLIPYKVILYSIVLFPAPHNTYQHLKLAR